VLSSPNNGGIPRASCCQQIWKLHLLCSKLVKDAVDMTCPPGVLTGPNFFVQDLQAFGAFGCKDLQKELSLGRGPNGGVLQIELPLAVASCRAALGALFELGHCPRPGPPVSIYADLPLHQSPSRW
jgi:hypothetical protein